MSSIIGYLSEGKLLVRRPDGTETEIKSAFVDSLRERLQSIKNRREWKMSGTGAQFARGGLPAGPAAFEVDQFSAQFSAACQSPETGCILYAIDAGDVHGIFSSIKPAASRGAMATGPDSGRRSFSNSTSTAANLKP